jgi:flagellar hook protein FlgE
MSFYTALTGLNGAQADISATSNNIANVGTTGFKRSRAEFGDIFATSPLQNASSSIGSGTILKGIKQQFTQGNIASSLNALDLAISGQGFFALKPSLTSSQTVYTRNGSFNVNNDRYVVDSAGQYLLVYPVNQDGSVTAKDLGSAVPLQLPVNAGEPKATSIIDLGVNLPADAPVVTSQPEFADGYRFDPANPSSYTNSTSITIFDDLGNPTIATIYFIKTQTASAEDPTNKYDTRLVINGTVIEPDLVNAVDDSGKQIFIDRFGNQTTQVPDDNYFIEGKGSPLYKLDDLNQRVPSQPASVRGEQSGFDFGEEGDKLVEIVTDPLLFNATREAGNPDSDLFWGKDFLLVNVDDGDAPVSINIRPGKYNAEQLAAEVERAINDAYGDDRKIQLLQNVDDRITIDLFRAGPDGSQQGLSITGQGPIEIDLLQPSAVSELVGIDVEGASPDFTREEFLAHAQLRINDALDSYIYDGNDVGAGATALGVDGRLFVRTVGEVIAAPPTETEVIEITHTVDVEGGGTDDSSKYLAYSYFGKRPTLAVYDNMAALAKVDANGALVTNGAGTMLTYDNTQNTLTVHVPADYETGASSIRLVGANVGENFENYLNGRELRVFDTELVKDDQNAVIYKRLRIDTSGLNLPDTGFSVAANDGVSILYEPSDTLEAFFEGSENGLDDVFTTFNSKKVVIREIGDAARRSKDEQSISDTAAVSAAITVGDPLLTGNPDVIDALGLTTTASRVAWVDEKNPPIKIGYDSINQTLKFIADRTVLGTGTGSNYNSFSIYSTADADGPNALGIPSGNNAAQALIRGGEVLATGSFVADGEEIQLNDKRYGIEVKYNSDTKSFTISSGTTGETIDANGAIGVTTDQKASNIQVGRRVISANGGGAVDTSEQINLDLRVIGAGDNALFGFGAARTDYSFQEGRGLAAKPAIATGKAAQSDLSEVFRLTSANGENRFNISVNGIAGIIDIPPGNYVGTTLASALEERINQITDPNTGRTVGGVKVRYTAATNTFTFTTGTTGDGSTIKVKGAARLGLDDVPLGVGSVPSILNLVQATNADGIALYVDPAGNVVTSPPENMVDGYYPLYIDEGELTFDKTGKLVSPRNNVRYEQQAEGFSISLDIDYSASTQVAQPFSVLSVKQDGFTSGRLDGLAIDSSGTIRANYTNGLNNPLGKIMMVNFNNQNGLKQIGNATYVETAVSGTPQVGEAGAEGFGTVLSGSLERSNVDITEELVNLITAQRNYQASAKAIETTTSLNQTIINIRM